MKRRLVAGPKAYHCAVYGRTFDPATGTLDLTSDDLAIHALVSAGWAVLPPHGTTAQRPTIWTPATAYYDDTIGAAIFPVISPPGSQQVASWVDGVGNSV